VARPFICRIYGTSARLRCDFGCKPDKELSIDEADEIQEEIISLWHSMKKVNEDENRWPHGNLPASIGEVAVAVEKMKKYKRWMRTA
jgi:hypothetical protein